MNRSIYYILFLISFFLSLIFTGCEEDNVDSQENYFVEFLIKASDNPNLIERDIVGTIEGQTITLEVSDQLDLTKLVASFLRQGGSVYVGDERQIPGVTVNDFSKPLVYSIVTDKGSRIDYQIKVVKVSDSEISFSSFAFLKENNTLLTRDYSGVISGDVIEFVMPSITRNLVATFETDAAEVLVKGIAQKNGITMNDFTQSVTYTLISEKGVKKSYTVSVSWSSPIPHIEIKTDQNAPIVSKVDYIYADLVVTANGWGSDFTGRTRIRGRGNSTWGLPKKPYRLKLDEDASILNLAPEKDWVLLANYLDPTLMMNAVAFKIGELLELRFTNHAIPVNVTINGTYAGSYMLTEQVERSKSRVDIHKEKGVLLELDINYDEDYQFISNSYALPVMIKDPDLSDFDGVERDELFQKIKSDFNQFEQTVASPLFPASNYKDYIDVESLVKYLITYNLTQNMEINHPKSTYMYKDAEGKYFMGPIWDFDWAFDYEGKGVHFTSTTNPLFRKLGSSSTGFTFFSRFLEDPEFRALYKVTWQKFRTEKFPFLLEYIDFYAAHMTDSQMNDYQTWKQSSNYPGTTNYPAKINQLKSWLEGRAYYIDTYVSGF